MNEPPIYDPDDPRHYYEIIWRNYLELYEKHNEMRADFKVLRERQDKMQIKVSTMWAWLITIGSVITVVLNILSKIPWSKIFSSTPPK